MAITATTQKRTFIFEGKELFDPGQHMSAKDVQDFYSNKHPELLNAAIKKTTENETTRFEFKTKLAENG